MPTPLAEMPRAPARRSARGDISLSWEALDMSQTHLPKPLRPTHDVPEEFVPGALPVEPDEGPGPAFIPDGPSDDRDNDPDATRDRPARHHHRHVEVTRCLFAGPGLGPPLPT